MNNRFGRNLFVPAVVLIAGLSAPLRADIIVNAGVTPANPFGPEIHASLGADAFTLFSKATINEITFWTAETSGLSFLGSFAWWIYTDAAGAPGAAEASGVASTQGGTDLLTRTQLPDTTPYGAKEFEDVIDLTSPLMLDPGGSPATYWLVLHNEDPTGQTNPFFPGLFWISADQSTGNGLANFNGNGWISTGMNEAFQLSGTGNDNPNNPNTVPEPASLALLGTALAGMGVVLGRRARG